MNAYDAEGTGRIQITLHSGERVDLRTITPEQIRIEDIAHALANLCRFTGHVPSFYSVAQHSVIVAEALPRREIVLRRQGLLHDATEAYLNDLSHFLKHSPELAGYRALEHDLEVKILRRFGLPETLDPRVKLADHWATEIEWAQMMNGERLSIANTIVPCAPAEAKRRFLSSFEQFFA